MQSHITLVGVLNIVYRAVAALGAGVLVALGFWFDPLMYALMRSHTVRPHDVPFEVMEFVPLILFIIAGVIILFSLLGIIGAIGVLRRKEWGRMLLLVISFFHLIRVPLGTVLELQYLGLAEQRNHQALQSCIQCSGSVDALTRVTTDRCLVLRFTDNESAILHAR